MKHMKFIVAGAAVALLLAGCSEDRIRLLEQKNAMLESKNYKLQQQVNEASGETAGPVTREQLDALRKERVQAIVKQYPWLGETKWNSVKIYRTAIDNNPIVIEDPAVIAALVNQLKVEDELPISSAAAKINSVQMTYELASNATTVKLAIVDKGLLRAEGNDSLWKVGRYVQQLAKAYSDAPVYATEATIFHRIAESGVWSIQGTNSKVVLDEDVIRQTADWLAGGEKLRRAPRSPGEVLQQSQWICYGIPISMQVYQEYVYLEDQTDKVWLKLADAGTRVMGAQ